MNNSGHYIELSKSYIDGLKLVWNLYLPWYTFVFTTNIISLGWLFSSENGVRESELQIFIDGAAVFMIINDILSIAFTAFLISFTKKGEKNLHFFNKKLVENGLDLPDNVAFPARLGVYAGKFIITALFLLILAWVVIIVI